MEPEVQAAPTADLLYIASYQLVSLRSRQADCEVWSSVHRPTNMEVVMEIYPKSGDDKRMIESIVRKVDLFSQLANNKVLRLLEVIDTDVAIFLVYENYVSQSLLEYAVNCPHSGKEFHRLVRSLIKIVQGLHWSCFFHGTLTLESFVLTPQKKIKFKDAPGCHTFLRCRQEPARFDAILSRASDIWSIGALIYRLVHHQLTGGSLPEFDSASTPEALPIMVAKLDPDLSDLLTRMTDQNPAARISTAECLRHPYLTRSSASLLLLSLQDSRQQQLRQRNYWDRYSGPVNQDVIRFLARATGAPAAELAAAAAANDLSGWSAAYWLLKQRLTMGRGYPPLDDAKDSCGYSGSTGVDSTKTQEQRHVEAEAAEAAGAAAGTPGQSAATKTGKNAATRQDKDAGYKRTVELLRDRRLGLAATPREASTSSCLVGKRRQAADGSLPPQRGDERPASLPPISVRSARQSDLSLSAEAAARALRSQQMQPPHQQQSLTSRYLSYIRRRDLEAPAPSPPPPQPLQEPPQPLQQQQQPEAALKSRGTSGTIHVRVHRRPRPSPTMPTTTVLSPRQPPNSRTELAPQLRGVKNISAAEFDAASDLEADAAPMGTQYLWENAIVRWQQWIKLRVI